MEGEDEAVKGGADDDDGGELGPEDDTIVDRPGGELDDDMIISISFQLESNYESNTDRGCGKRMLYFFFCCFMLGGRWLLSCLLATKLIGNNPDNCGSFLCLWSKCNKLLSSIFCCYLPFKDIFRRLQDSSQPIVCSLLRIRCFVVETLGFHVVPAPCYDSTVKERLTDVQLACVTSLRRMGLLLL